MTFYWNLVKNNTLLGFRSVIVPLCTLFVLSACIALDSNISQQNNSSSPIPTTQTNQTKDAESLRKTNWQDHEKQIKKDNKQKREKNKANMAELQKSFNVKNRMSLGTASSNLPLKLATKSFSFKTEDVDIRSALREFANKYELDVFIDRDIEGDITVDFQNLSLKKAMTLILGKHNYFWEWNNDLIRISRLQTKVFVIDYLRLTRSSQGSSSAKLVSSANKRNNEDDKSASNIEKNDSLAFWDEIERQVSSLISDQGRSVINRLSGTIQITDIPTRIDEIETFISSLQQALHRQVEIEARILEVTLNDDHALGVDWNSISIKGITGSLTSAITGGNQGIGLKTNTLALGFSNSRFSALISALEEQGSIKVVSQPRLRIINNQPALIKVGSDRTFFTQTVNREIGNGGLGTVFITDEPYTITEGLVLSVTPQISKDRWIMLDISPVITRITDIVTSSQGSTAPILDIKQASTLIRAKDGEMVILGGLIKSESAETNRQVPLFEQLPFVGSLFKGDYSTHIKKELIIFLVPRLVI